VKGSWGLNWIRQPWKKIRPVGGTFNSKGSRYEHMPIPEPLGEAVRNKTKPAPFRLNPNASRLLGSPCKCRERGLKQGNASKGEASLIKSRDCREGQGGEKPRVGGALGEKKPSKIPHNEKTEQKEASLNNMFKNHGHRLAFDMILKKRMRIGSVGEGATTLPGPRIRGTSPGQEGIAAWGGRRN